MANILNIQRSTITAFGLLIIGIMPLEVGAIILLVIVATKFWNAKRISPDVYLLILFAILRYLLPIMLNNSDESLIKSISKPIILVGAYLLGLNISNSQTQEMNDSEYFKYNYSFSIGLSAYAIISLFFTIVKAPGLLLQRDYYDIWEQNIRHATVLSDYLVFLAIMIINTSILKRAQKKKVLYQATGLFITGFIISISLYLGNRRIILFILLAILFNMLYIRGHRMVFAVNKNKLSYMILSIILVAFASFFIIDRLALLNDAYTNFAERFSRLGVHSSRYDLWKAGLGAVLTDPWKGGIYPAQVGFPSLPAYHNIWLDIWMKSGLLPTIVFIAFNLFQFHTFLKVLTKNGPSPELKISILGVTIIVYMIYMTTTVLTGAFSVFIYTMFIQGYIKSLASSEWLKVSGVRYYHI